MTSDITQLLTLISQTVASLATIAIAIIAYIVSKRAYEAQSRSTLLSMINDFNALALTNDECLKTFHRLLFGHDAADLKAARETWATYSFLNNRQLHYFLAKTSHTGQAYLAEDKRNLERLLTNGGVRDVLISGGYDPDFVRYCLSTEAGHSARTIRTRRGRPVRRDRAPGHESE